MKFQTIITKIYGFLVVATMLTPLVISKAFAYPTQSPKTFFFFAIISLILPFFAYLCLIKKELRPNIKDPILVSYALFLLTLTISSLFGISPFKSFFGNHLRMDGLFFLYGTLLSYCYLVTLYKLHENNKRRMIILFYGIFAIIAGYGILQWLNIVDASIYDRRSSSFPGNPIFFAAVMILPLFMSFGEILKHKHTKQQKYYIALFIFYAFGFLSAGTRGAVVGVVSASFCWLIYFLYTKKSNKKYHYTNAIMIILIMVGIFTIGILQQNKSSFFYRFTHFSGTNTDSRLEFWKMAINGFKERPILGIGYQNFYHYADKYNTKASAIYDNTWTDKPHNYFLEILSTGGIITFLAYISFLIIIGKTIIKTEHSFQKEALFFGFMAYLIQNIFSFETVDSTFPLIVLFSFLSQNTTTNQVIIPKIKHVQKMYLLFFVILFLFPFSIIAHVIKPTVQQYTLIQRRNIDEFIDYFDHKEFVYDYEFLALEYYDMLNYAYKKRSLSTERKQKLIAITKTIYEEAIKRSPEKSSIWYSYSGLQYLNSFQNNEEITEEKLNIAKHAIELSPNRVEPMVFLIAMYIKQEKIDEALEIAKKGYEINPNDPQLLWIYSQLHKLRGNLDEAVKLATKSLEQNMKIENSEPLNWMINYYIEKKDFVHMTYLYEKTVEFEPENEELKYKLAMSYKIIGQNKKALDTANKELSKGTKFKKEFNELIKEIVQN